MYERSLEIDIKQVPRKFYSVSGISFVQLIRLKWQGTLDYHMTFRAHFPSYTRDTFVMTTCILWFVHNYNNDNSFVKWLQNYMYPIVQVIISYGWSMSICVCMMVYNEIASKYKLLARVILCACIWKRHTGFVISSFILKLDFRKNYNQPQ